MFIPSAQVIFWVILLVFLQKLVHTTESRQTALTSNPLATPVHVTERLLAQHTCTNILTLGCMMEKPGRLY